MIRIKDAPLVGAAESRFARVASDLSRSEHARFEALLPGCVRRARSAARHWDVCAPANILNELISNTELFPAACRPEEQARLQKAVIGRLALDFFEVRDRLPASVVAEYEDLWLRISAYVAEQIEGSYPFEYFAKDVRYALGLTAPCGTLCIDLDYSIGPKLIARAVAFDRNLRPALDYLGSRGWGRWYNDHMDTRDLREFNPAGWTASFRRFGEVLALNPSVRGITGVSWFYDPAVCEISPNLAYIQQAQVANGAFRVRLGVNDADIQNATTRSPTRKRLYEEGVYRPTSYLLAWPRSPLLRWAKSLQTEEGRGFEAWKAEKSRETPVLLSA
jgi:hypothetical protein